MEPAEEEGGEGHGQAHDGADADFAEEEFPPVGGVNFAGGDGADDEGGGLGAGVAAAADEQGQEEDEDDDGGDGVFEELDAGAGEDVDEDEAEEPANAFAIEEAEGGFFEADLQGLDGGQFVEVFGGGVGGDVEDVVHGDDAEEDVVFVHDGQGVEVVFAEDLDGLFFVLLGMKAGIVAVEKSGDGDAGVGQDEAAQGEVVAEVAGFVRDVDHGHGFGVGAGFAQVFEGLGHGPFGMDGDIAVGHEAADAVLGIAQEGEGLFAVRVVEKGEEALGDTGGEFLEEGGAVVGREGGEDGLDFLVGHFAEELVLVDGIEQREDFVGELAGEDAEEKDAVFVGDDGKKFGNLGSGLFEEEVTQFVEMSVGEHVQDIGEQEVAQDHGRPRAGWWGGWIARPVMSQSQDEVGDGKIDEDAEDVGHGGDEGGAGGGGVEIEFVEADGQERAEKAAGHDNSHHAEGNSDGNFDVAAPKAESKNSEGHGEAQECAEDELAAEELTPVAGMDFAGGDGADDERGGLGAGIATAVDEERKEEDESDHGGDGVFEHGHAGAGDDAGGHEAQQPADALAHQQAERGMAQADVQGLDGGEFVEVFGGDFFGDVEDVVHGDDAEHDVVLVHDGEGMEVVFAEDLDGFFFVLLGVEAGVAAIEEGEDRCVGIGQDEAAQGEVVAEVAGFVRDIDHGHGFGVGADFAQVGKGLGHGPFGMDGDIAVGHEAADTVLGVAQEGEGLHTVGIVEHAKEAPHDAGGQLFEEGGAVVRGEGGEDMADFLVGHFVEELVLEDGVEQGEHLVGEMPRKNAEEEDPVLVGDDGEELGDFGGGLVGEEFTQFGELAGVQQFEDFRQEEMAQDHGRPPGGFGRRAARSN